MKNDWIEYKTDIGLKQTKIVDGKEVFVDWLGNPIKGVS